MSYAKCDNCGKLRKVYAHAGWKDNSPTTYYWCEECTNKIYKELK